MSTTTSVECFAPVVVNDPTDSRLDDIRNLNKSDSRPGLPGGRGLVIAEGTLVVPRLVRSCFPLRAIFGTHQKLVSPADGLTVSEAAIAETVPWFEPDHEVLAAAARFNLHRGLLATVDHVPGLSVGQVLSGTTTLAVMGGVGDHKNIGALFHNAASMGVDGVVFGAAYANLLYRHGMHVSMGHMLTVPSTTLPGTTTTWQRSLGQLKEQGFRVVSMTPAGTMNLWDAMDTNKIAILVGAEGPGLIRHAMVTTDVHTRIPVPPGTNNLNVVASTTIAFYKRLRIQSQRAEQ